MTEYTPDQWVAALRVAVEHVADAEADAADKRERRDRVMVAAVAGGVPAAEVARVAGVSRQRVSVLVKRAGTVSARVHAQKQEPASVRVNDPATVPGIPDTPDGVTSGVVSLRDRKPYGRETVFVDIRTHPTVGEVLEVARMRNAGRVYLTGPAPLDPSTGATQAEQVRAWVMGELPNGWAHGEHYLSDPALPVCRYTFVNPYQSGAREQRVTVMRAAMWWGETDADSETCVRAWEGLGRMIEGVSAFAGSGIADTPATTGRALWLRTIPEGRGFEVMASELRQLVAETSGQGRIQLRGEPGPGPAVELGGQLTAAGSWEDFTYLDGRFMYAALTWGMPVGEPALWSGGAVEALSDQEGERVLRGRGRWRVTATVPDTWQHVGMLMCPDPAGGWCYPSGPGQVFTTWADGAEVWAAIGRGWGIELHEGITWREGKPLNTWRDHLVELWRRADEHGRHGVVEAGLAARAIRAIVLHAIGAFAARSHPITRTAPAASNPDVPAGVEVRLVGDNLVWQEPATPSAWSERTAHPEWSATVWARARVRLTEAALRLPPDRVVAFATDALYVAGGDPGWDDDGKPGAFRSKGTRPGPFAWPATYNDLYTLRDEAEAAR